MANTSYQVSLSTDGRHTVTVTGDDPKELQAALAWAKAIHAALAERSSATHSAATETAAVVETAPASEPDGETPVCAVHQVPMVRMQGRKGPFWSCHERGADGRFCTYRPPLAA